jgi:hypothetical protein
MYFSPFRYIFSRFGMLRQEKSGNPAGASKVSEKWRLSLHFISFHSKFRKK